MELHFIPAEMKPTVWKHIIQIKTTLLCVVHNKGLKYCFSTTTMISLSLSNVSPKPAAVVVGGAGGGAQPGV